MLNMLQLQIQPNILQFLISKYDTNRNGIEFGEFLAIMAYVMICKKLMNKYDA